MAWGKWKVVCSGDLLMFGPGEGRVAEVRKVWPSGSVFAENLSLEDANTCAEAYLREHGVEVKVQRDWCLSFRRFLVLW